MRLPRVQPIIPISKKEPFEDPDWLFEFKYDGFRALLYVEVGTHCRFVSRNGNTLTRFDELCKHVAAEFEADDAILDGEMIAADETGRPLFYDLLRRTRRPAYVAFSMVTTYALCL
jgi:bifunctional non-homologous end joining protein LigD